MKKEKAFEILQSFNVQAATVVPLLNKLGKEADDYRSNLQKEFLWDFNSDARLTVFGKICNTLNAATLSYVALMDYYLIFDQGSFWRKVKEEEPEFTAEDLVVHILSFNQSTLFSLFHQFYSGVESSLRIFLKEQSVLLGQNGTKGYQDVFETLIDRVCKIKDPKSTEYWNTLHILAVFRNCIHNNGVYMPNDNSDYSITIDIEGRDKLVFVFKYGKPVKINFDEQVVLFSHVLKLLDEIIRSEPISSVKKMSDPVTPELFDLM